MCRHSIAGTIIKGDFNDYPRQKKGVKEPCKEKTADQESGVERKKDRDCGREENQNIFIFEENWR